MASIGSLSIDIGLNTGGLERELAALESRCSRLSDLLGGVANGAGVAGAGVGNLGRQAAGAAAGFELIGSAASKSFGAIAGYAQGGVGLFVDFQKGLNKFASASGATGAELKTLNDTAIQLAKDTSKTAPEVARAAVEYTKLGFSAKDTAKELGGLVALSEAAGISVEQSASIVGAGSSVFGRSAKDIANIVAVTSDATAANAEDMLQAFSKAGGVFKANNQDLETLATSFGLLRQAGFSAEMAGTALKTSITSLAAPSKRGQAALDTLGVSVRDGEGNMRNFLDLIPEFRAALANVEVADRAKLTKDVFGAEAGPAVTGLLGMKQEDIDKTRTQVGSAASDGTAASDKAKILMQGLPGAIEQMSGSLETLQLKIGESLGPALVSLSSGITSVVNSFLSLPAPIQGAAIGIAGAATAITALIAGVAALNTLQVGASLAAGATQAQNLVGKILSASTSFDLFGASSGTALKGLVGNAGAGAASLGKLVGVAGLAVLAGYSIAAAWDGLNLALGTDSSTVAINADTEALRLQTDEVLRGRGELELLTAAKLNADTGVSNLFSQEGLAEYLGTLQAAFDAGGPIEVLQTMANDAIAIFFDLDAKLSEIFAGIIGKLNESIQTASGLINLLPGGSALTTTSQGVADAASRDAQTKRSEATNVKKDGFLTTNSERQAENTGGAITKRQEEVNRSVEAGSRLLEKYGLSQNTAANAEKLSSEEKAKFSEEAKKQISLYDGQIAALKKIKPANDEQKATIEAEIATLQKNKKAYQERVTAVEGSAKATTGATSAYSASVAALEKESSSVLAQLKADVAQQVASGQLTEEEGQSMILAKEQEYYDKRIALNKEKIGELLALKAAGASGDELLSINKQIGDLEKSNVGLSQKSGEAASGQNSIAKKGEDKAAKAAEAETKKADSEAKKGEDKAAKAAEAETKKADSEAKKRQDEAKKAEQFIQQQEQTAIRNQESTAMNAVKLGVLDGSINEEDAALKTAQIRATAVDQELGAESAKLSRMRAMLAAGVIDKEEAASQELQIGEKLVSLELKQTESRIAVQDAARKKILQSIADANKKAEAAIQLSGTERESVVRSQQAVGGLTSTQADAEIARITAESNIQSQELVAQKIAQVQMLKANGTLAEREANDQLMTLEQQRADLNLTQINGQIAARAVATAAAIALIDLEGRTSVSAIQSQQAAIGAVLTSLKGQQELMAAQEGLFKAKDDLALQQMQARGATEAEIAAFKLQAMDREQAHSMQMLDISIQMRGLESERELRAAKIAEIEAQIAISKAEANGATKEEIALLAEALRLRQQNVAESEQAISRQSQLGEIQKETLQVQQQTQREKAQADAAPSGSGGGGGGSTTVMTRNLYGEDIDKNRLAMQKFENLTKSPGGATRSQMAQAAIANQDDKFFLEKLAQAGMGDIAQLADLDKAGKLTSEQRNKIVFGGTYAGGDNEGALEGVLNELKNLNSNVSGALKEPKNISLSTATPTKDLLDIMGGTRTKRY